MRVLIAGVGGREHALVWKILQSPRVSEVLQVADAAEALALASKGDVGLAVVQQDNLLAAGLVDQLTSMGVRTFGPTKAQAKIEWSKEYAKYFMNTHGVPTARTFRGIDEAPLPVVIKADGLKQGKGVVIAHTREEAADAVRELGPDLVIEEFLEGTEISIHAWCDGASARLFPVSRDHKRVGDGNTGPNTGGMGTIAPVSVPQDVLDDIHTRVVMPVVRETGFRGVLYPGLMLTKDGYRVLEYNARFGDPETESYVRLLTTDIVDCFDACIDGTIAQLTPTWSSEYVVTVMLCSGGYPDTYQTGFPISGITEAESEPGIVVFKAGAEIKQGMLVTNGGRVLAVSAVGATRTEARERAYRAADKINFVGKQYRTDIGA